MSKKEISRRTFFRDMIIGGTATVGAAYVLTACKGGGGKSTELKCTDTSGLDQGAIQARMSANYTDHSQKADQDCTNCLNFKPPGKANTCGGCKVLKGPINPKGWCKLWAKKA